jgi:hypothetical protein
MISMSRDIMDEYRSLSQIKRRHVLGKTNEHGPDQYRLDFTSSEPGIVNIPFSTASSLVFTRSYAFFLHSPPRGLETTFASESKPQHRHSLIQTRVRRRKESVH